MPNKKSAIKRVRQNERRRVRNRAVRGDMRTAVKQVDVVIAANDASGVDSAIKLAQSKLAKAAKRNIIKKNNQSRKTSRLMKAANRARAAEAAKA